MMKIIACDDDDEDEFHNVDHGSSVKDDNHNDDNV